MFQNYCQYGYRRYAGEKFYRVKTIANFRPMDSRNRKRIQGNSFYCYPFLTGISLKQSYRTQIKQTTKQRPVMPCTKREDILIFPKLYTFIEKYTCNDGPHYIFQSVSIDQISKSVLEMNHPQFFTITLTDYHLNYISSASFYDIIPHCYDALVFLKLPS